MSGHDAILCHIQSTPLGKNPALSIPPSSFTELKGRFVNYVSRHSLSIEFPFDVRFLNPTGGYQGGMMATLVDNSFGFLSYLSAGHPCVTLNLTLSYIRGFRAEDTSVLVEAVVVARGQTYMTLQATVVTAKKKLVATALTQVQIVKN